MDGSYTTLLVLVVNNPVSRLLIYVIESLSAWVATDGRPTPVFYNSCPCIPITEFANELNICVHVICEFYINCRTRFQHLIS